MHCIKRLEPMTTITTIVDNNTPEQALEVTVGREHDAFKTSQLGRPRKLWTMTHEPQWIGIQH